MPGGRPKWIPTPEICGKAETYAAQGMTQDQIAQCLGISHTTLYERKNEYAEFTAAIKNGQAKGIEMVTNSLFKKANDGDNVAAIFYLKNRAGWSDKQQMEHTGSVKIERIERTIKDVGD
jgi:DNA-binding XRE family transcriptional regulator